MTLNTRTALKKKSPIDCDGVLTNAQNHMAYQA